VTADVGVNLNNVKDAQLEALVKYRVKSMKVSIDGASQETYEQYRVGGNFDKVIANVKRN
jgi:MoaA/NifB/PqqE/SkfB family radical SAM enzyme